MTRATDSLATLAGFVQTYLTDADGKPLRLSRGQEYACDQLDAGMYGDGFAGAAIEMPRGAGKSMLMKAAIVRWFLRGGRYVALVASGSLFEQFSRDIASIVTGHGAPLVIGSNGRPLLLTDHDIRPGLEFPVRANKDAQLWNVQDRLIYVGGWGVEHRRKLSVRGMTGGKGSVRGLVDGAQRPDLGWIDDPMKEAEADNPGITDDVKAFVKRTFIPGLSPTARVCMTGTPFNSRDLITEAAGNARTPPLVSEWPALARACLPAEHPVSGAPLTPHWPKERLQARRELIGSRAYAQEYKLSPQGDGAAHFEEGWIARWTAPAPEPHPRWGGRRVMYCDPSLGRSSRSDTSAIVVIDVWPDGVTWVRHASIGRRRPQALVAAYLDIWDRWRPTHHATEDEGAQELLIPMFDAEARARGLPPEALPGLQSTEGVPKVTRIKRLSGPVEFGRIRWDANGDHRELRAQLTGWGGTPNELDDGPDALEGATRVGAHEVYATPGVVTQVSPW